MIGRRPFSNRRIKRWMQGKLTLGAVLRLKTSDRDDLALQAYRRVEAADFDAARRLFELLGRLWPDAETSARLGLGVCAQRQGNLTEAEAAYGDVLAVEPENIYALANRAEVRLLNDRKEAAQADLTAALTALGKGRSPASLRRRVEALQSLIAVEARPG